MMQISNNCKKLVKLLLHLSSDWLDPGDGVLGIVFVSADETRQVRYVSVRLYIWKAGPTCPHGPKRSTTTDRMG